ncbi:MAG: TIGR03086 family metal-binding protein [Acidimicrobiia bacterium]|nr:TIGR03086 family metal-binding protein [Acidimicrobiia bacterium]
MDARTALENTNTIMNSVISQLTSDHRHMSTPCTEWDVHQVIDHVCQGSHGIAGALQGQAPPENADEIDLLAKGPANGWAEAYNALSAAATPDILSATHQLPFGEMPGEAAMSVIVADALVHAWDVASGAGVDIDISDELAEWGLATWKMVVPAEGRQGGFGPVVPVADDASALDRLLGYTGRQP